jgi:hypothetical protein
MARMNNEGQWIVLIGFIVAISLFFLATIVNESTLVGQTTSESVLDFSKADIQDVNQKVKDIAIYGNIYTLPSSDNETIIDIEKLYSNRKGVIINITIQNPTFPLWQRNVTLHYNNGITTYNAFNEDYY